MARLPVSVGDELIWRNEWLRDEQRYLYRVVSVNPPTVVYLDAGTERICTDIGCSGWGRWDDFHWRFADEFKAWVHEVRMKNDSQQS